MCVRVCSLFVWCVCDCVCVCLLICLEPCGGPLWRWAQICNIGLANPNTLSTRKPHCRALGLARSSPPANWSSVKRWGRGTRGGGGRRHTRSRPYAQRTRARGPQETFARSFPQALWRGHKQSGCLLSRVRSCLFARSLASFARRAGRAHDGPICEGWRSPTAETHANA